MPVHPTAIIHEEAKVEDTTIIGPYTIVEKNTVIGSNSFLSSHVYVGYGARIGDNVKIYQGAVVSEIPPDLKFQGEDSVTEIGDNTVIREYATIHRGTKDRRKTVIGKNCVIMAYAHIAHDCIIGNNVIMANAVHLAGHVIIEDWAIVGGLVAVHQFCRIGSHSFVGGGFRVVKDVPPFVLAASEPLKFVGLNVVGLRRRGFTREQLSLLKSVYKIIYRSEVNVSQALKQIEERFSNESLAMDVVRFVRKSERGIIS
jgi:UDP-N-acetylglucosamine acyltransferase